MAYYTKKDRHIWLSALSGILLWLAWPDNVFGLLLHLAFIPLLIIESELAGRYYKRPALRYFFFLFLTFMIWHTLSIISANARDISLLNIFLNSCLMTIPMMLFFFTKRASGQIAGYFSFIIYWIAFEYLMLHWNIRGPWPILGNGFASFPYLVQWYEITGQQGGSLWILCCNLILFHTIKTGYINPMGVALFSFLFILPSGASIFRYLTYHTSGQPTGVVISYPGTRDHTVTHNNGIGPRDQDEQINVLLKSTHILTTQKTPDSSSLSKECRHFEVRSIRSAAFYPHYLLFGKTGANNLFISPLYYHDIKKSANFRQLSICTKNSTLIGIMSENELISGEPVTAYIRKGARLIFFITTAHLPRSRPGLHSQHARLRSIETRRDILLSSETTITGYISQKGDYIETPISSLAQPLLIRDNISLNAKETFYVKYGDYIGISSFYFALICIFILFGGILVKRTNFI